MENYWWWCRVLWVHWDEQLLTARKALVVRSAPRVFPALACPPVCVARSAQMDSRELWKKGKPVSCTAIWTIFAKLSIATFLRYLVEHCVWNFNVFQVNSNFVCCDRKWRRCVWTRSSEHLSKSIAMKCTNFPVVRANGVQCFDVRCTGQKADHRAGYASLILRNSVPLPFCVSRSLWICNTIQLFYSSAAGVGWDTHSFNWGGWFPRTIQNCWSERSNHFELVPKLPKLYPFWKPPICFSLWPLLFCFQIFHHGIHRNSPGFIKHKSQHYFKVFAGTNGKYTNVFFCKKPFFVWRNTRTSGLTQDWTLRSRGSHLIQITQLLVQNRLGEERNLVIGQHERWYAE